MRLACAALLLFAGIGLNAATPKAETPKTEAPPVLRKSPEFVIKFVDGKQMLLSSLKGKVVALLMVHTTCPHCQHTSQVFTQLYNEYGARGFQPVDAAFNTMANMYVSRFREELQHWLPGGLQHARRGDGVSGLQRHGALHGAADRVDRPQGGHSIADAGGGRRSDVLPGKLLAEHD
jgi:thiol-disulfide isomerase/thioredoxin